MESLKLVYELSVLSQQLKIGLLNHFYKKYNPVESNALKVSLTNVYLSHLEASDYRSAYHQLCDWLYGWNVADSSPFSAADDNPFRTARMPRAISLEADIERVECDRILSTYQTLYHISKRQLMKQFGDIEQSLPRMGEGLVGTTTIGPGQKRDDPSEIDAPWNKATSSDSPSVFDEDTDVIDDSVPPELQSRESAVFKAQKLRRGSLMIKGNVKERSNSSTPDPKTGDKIMEEDSSEVTPPSSSESNHTSEVSSRAITAQDIKNEIQPSNTTQQTGAPTSPFVFYKAKGGNLVQGLAADDGGLILQKDILFVLLQVDRSTDYTLVIIINILVILSFAEVLGKKDVHLKFCTHAHELASDFISNTLKGLYDLLRKEFGDEIELNEIRDLNCLGNRLKALADKREETGEIKKQKYRFKKLHRKFELLHILFSGLDIHLFPRFVQAHCDGTKSACYSEFDSALWLTGGYDGIVRIHDFRPGIQTGVGVNPLAQLIGHKSIVTEVQFSKNDSNVISCSFDRTIKIWNSSSGNCEKTLLGHTDSVTTCHVTKDGRYIASGSMDNTVRVWDFIKGDCVAIIRKHTRWVKVVRFSQDGRYLASAGLDRKIYVWDTKWVVNTKNATHTRCFDAHTDTVLDMAMTKQGQLVTTSRDCSIRVFDITQNNELYCIELTSSWCCSVAISADGDYFVTGDQFNNVNIYKTKTGEHIRHARVFNMGILCVRFPRDLEYVIVGSSDGLLQQIPL